MINETGAGALDGVRIVDLTTILMGPLATRILADHGADVIRVEATRVPETLVDEDGVGAGSLYTQRNKRSIKLDLKSDAGRRAMADLVSSADVFVSNMRTAALDRLGLSAETLRAKQPDLIHCVANGYGQTGPYADNAAYDDAIQAASGLADLFGQVHGEPAYVPSVIVDKICSMFVVQSVLAAVLHRRNTGEGQTIQVPMFETMVAFNLVEHFQGQAMVPPRGEIGYPRLLTEQRKPYRCADGFAAILPYSGANWLDFFAIIGRPELGDNERFANHALRVANADELYGIVAESAPERTVAEWLEICAAHSIPAMPVKGLSELVDDPHVQAVELLNDEEHPVAGPYRNVRDPVSYDTISTGLRRHAPVPGQHTAEVMAELGWSEADIAGLS